jgi:hypothetical protein
MERDITLAGSWLNANLRLSTAFLVRGPSLLMLDVRRFSESDLPLTR